MHEYAVVFVKDIAAEAVIANYFYARDGVYYFRGGAGEENVFSIPIEQVLFIRRKGKVATAP